MLILSVLWLIYLNINVNADVEGYGPTIIEIIEYKVSNLDPQINISVGVDQIKQNLLQSMVVEKQKSIEEAKFTLSTTQDGKPKLKIFRKMLRKPCSSIYYDIFLELFPVFKGNLINNKGVCEVKKNTYTANLNPMAVASVLVGQKFYYGKFLFQLSASAKRKTLFLVSCYFEFKKPN